MNRVPARPRTGRLGAPVSIRVLSGATAMTLGLALPLLGAPGTAAAAARTLYVKSGAGCSDDGPATQAQPLCTVQRAADQVQPGETVQIGPGKYPEQVTLTTSGTPQQPISFVGGQLRDGIDSLPVLNPFVNGGFPGEHGLVLDGVHDVRVSGLAIGGRSESVLLKNTGNVVLDGNRTGGGTFSSSTRKAAVRLTGTTGSTVLSRNVLRGYEFDAIAVDAGVQGTVITTNVVDNLLGAGGVLVTDAPGTVVTNNSISSGCSPAVELAGVSGGAYVENNVLAASSDLDRTGGICEAADHPAKLSVSAGSAAGTVADYNLVTPFRGAAAYEWAGTTYPDSTAFAKNVAGHGAHDLTGDAKVDGYQSGMQPRSDSPAVDSADANAPGVLDTDLLGYHRIDDPYVANSGTGNGYLDRGARELTTSTAWIGLESPIDRVPIGTPVTFHVNDQERWSRPVLYTVDYGDGSDPQSFEPGSGFSHTYLKQGAFTPSVVATMGNGDTVRGRGTPITVSPDGLMTTSVTTHPTDSPLQYSADLSVTSPWSVARTVYDWGDGTAPSTDSQHTYAREGDYGVTATVTDAGGRTVPAHTTVHATYLAATFHPLSPTRLVDTRSGLGGSTTVAAGGTLKVPLQRVMPDPAIPYEATPNAVVLNVTAVSAAADGHLTAFPSGAPRPTTSNVNYTAGRPVPNLVTVPVGADGTVSIGNSFGGSTDVVVDLLGYYSSVTQIGDRYTPLQPARIADTRSGGGPIGTDAARDFTVTGTGGVPTEAAAVVLNLTSTEATQPTHLTVWPAGESRPNASSLNPVPGQDTGNQVIVPVGAGGKVSVYNHAGSTQVVLDVAGYYSYGGRDGLLFTPITPRRLLDTRTGSGPLGADGTVEIDGAPATSPAAVFNVTATEGTADTYLTVYPSGTARPGTSSLNVNPGRTVPNQVTSPLGTGGRATVYNHLGRVQVIADLFGYFTKG
ncbi:NosD domain-containing protein [Kitasatospora sp. NPDC049285]|uniref:NosD domain-containing protein n=1 Tax=Kitasatospora sp. NPDC049285 TaxID=3157096 RepID=UPI00341B0695